MSELTAKPTFDLVKEEHLFTLLSCLIRPKVPTLLLRIRYKKFDDDSLREMLIFNIFFFGLYEHFQPMLNGDHRLNVEPKRRGFPPNSSGPRDQRGGSMNRGGGGGGMGGPGRGGRPMGSMGMSSGGPPREGGGGRGMGSGGRGGYMPRRQ